MHEEEIIRNLPKALINWYAFNPGEEALFVSGGDEACEVLYEALKESRVKTVRTTEESLSAPETAEAVTESPEESGAAEELIVPNTKFDYIIAAGILERSKYPTELLSKLKALLKPAGRLFLGAENRLALRYFCGDKDPFSGHVFDGVDGYRKVVGKAREHLKGRAFAKAELESMLTAAGFAGYRFYSVWPCLTRPQLILSENYQPNESLDARIFPQYNSPETVFLEEEKLYGTLLENRMFHQMAGAFLLECPADGKSLDIGQITVQGERSRERALATIIKSHKTVTKRAMYPEGRQKIKALMEHTEYLRQHNVPMTEAWVEKDAFVMPYVEGEIATEYLRNLLRRDKDDFVRELTAFREMIENSSEHVPYSEVNWQQFEPGWEKRKKDDPNLDKWEKLAFGSEEERRDIGVILKRGYVDLVSINCFHTERGFLFFDQELYLENFPANAIFIRTIDFIYKGYPELEQILPWEEVLKQFHLYEHRATWWKAVNLFLNTLRNDRALGGYHRRFRRDERTVMSNRYRMDYTQEEYDRLFGNIFKGADNKKIYLFGSGNYAKQFIEQFGKYYEIAGILDNDQDRWGRDVSGVKISGPDCLQDMEEPFKVFICIKYFEEVLSQLKEMRVKDISVYDPRLSYERPFRQAAKQEDTGPKKYHVGYVAGVFDLFHIGHLNILRRAKEQCDYLLVGVVSDEQVIKSKKTSPYIPFAERLEIVQACRYVDEAVMIPADRPNTEDAWYMHHFDVQFSGSDYAEDPAWLARKVFLQQHGADMVFFPYTETTSSTAIKEQIICSN